MLLLLVCACQKEEPSITLSETEIDAVYTAGEVSITIEPNVSWTAEVHYNDWREEKWIELPVTSGLEGPQRFVIRLPENPTRIREAKVYFHLAGTQELTILLVKQIGKLDRDMTDQLDIYTAAAMMLAHPPLGYISYEDIVKCKSLTYENINESMDCWGLALLENLVSIGVRNSNIPSLGFKAAPWLKNLSIKDSTLGDMDISGNPELENLHFKEVSLRSLEATHNPRLSSIEFEYSDMTPDLESVVLGPGVKGFGIMNAKSLEILDCSDATSLAYLSFPNCSVRRLDLSRTQVGHLEIRQNPIDELLLPDGLETLFFNMCSGAISYLKIGSRTRTVTVSGLTLEELDLDEAVNLSSLYCCNNMLKGLDISHIQMPSYFLFGGNPGVDGVFEIKVSSSDFETARTLYEGLQWDMEDYGIIVTQVCPGAVV